jgi:hypothetical protein
MVDEFIVELRGEGLVVYEDHISLTKGFEDRLLIQKIPPDQMYFSRHQTPEATSRLELVVLEIGEVTGILHNLATPAFATNFQRCLEHDIPNARAQVDEDLIGFQTGLLEDIGDKPW